jgi:hypothetical protein
LAKGALFSSGKMQDSLSFEPEGKSILQGYLRGPEYYRQHRGKTYQQSAENIEVPNLIKRNTMNMNFI